MTEVHARCCIVGGGPAGMMAAMLFARAGVATVLLEKHADFLRDFRGDTIHPSTLDVMDELGLLESFLTRPHQKSRRWRATSATRSLRWRTSRISRRAASSSHSCRSGSFSTSWRRKRSDSHASILRMQARAEDLLWENGRVVGRPRANASGSLEVRADLTIAADGRESVLRRRARLRRDRARRADGRALVAAYETSRRSAPNLRVYSRRPNHGADRPRRLLAVRLRHSKGHARRTACSAAWKSFAVRSARSFRSCTIGSARSKHWDDVKLLTVRVNRLREWYRPGLLCIGDAAHAMSPIGGVGINLAIQDAVAAANILASRLLRDGVTRRTIFAPFSAGANRRRG